MNECLSKTRKKGARATCVESNALPTVSEISLPMGDSFLQRHRGHQFFLLYMILMSMNFPVVLPTASLPLSRHQYPVPGGLDGVETQPQAGENEDMKICSPDVHLEGPCQGGF